MKASKLLALIPAGLLLGACAPNPSPAPYEPTPRYEPAPPADHHHYDPAPMSLHDRVHDALRREMGNAASGITVRVEGSTVYLGGHTSSHSDHDRAHDIAHDVSGVGSVDHSALKVH